MKASTRYTEDREAAIDILNQSFMKILLSLKQLDHIDTFFGWAKQIGVRTAIDELRKHKKHTERTKYIIDNDEAVTPFEIESDDFIESKLETNAIFELIASLPYMNRTVLNMVAIDGFSHKETAEHLEITEEYSRQLLTKARKMMKEKIKEINLEKINYS